MKQGSASSKGSSPSGRSATVSKAVNPAAVARIGIAGFVASKPLYEGRGSQSPGPKSTTIHHCGSQGKR